MAAAVRPGRRVSAPASLVAVVGFFVAAVLPRATWPVVDIDTFWHIRAGFEVLETGAVPRVDTWSIPAAGSEWTSQDWLSNVVLAAGWGLGDWGQVGLSLLYGLAVLAAFALLWRAIALRVPGIGWAARIGWLTPGLVVGGLVMGVKVQVVDLALAAAVLWTLWSYLAAPRWQRLIWLPLIAVAWANLHAGWALLFLFAGAVLAGELLDRALRRPLAPAPLGPRQLLELGGALAVSFAALAVNPNGLELYAYPLETAAISSLGRYVQEWLPPTLDSPFGPLISAFAVLVVLPTLLLGPRRLRTADALIAGGVLIMALMAVRFFLIAGPIASAVACVVLAPRLSASGIGRSFGPVLGRLSARRPGRLGALNLGLAAAVMLIGLAVVFARVHPDAQERERGKVVPVFAVEWMLANEPGQRVFNRNEWGGYLGLLRPDLPIFVDGRADVYGDRILEEYVATVTLRIDPQTTLDRYRIDHVLFPPNSAFGRWLDDHPAWRRAYGDELAAVWVRDR